jgi:hypothetical protein
MSTPSEETSLLFKTNETLSRQLEVTQKQLRTAQALGKNYEMRIAARTADITKVTPHVNNLIQAAETGQKAGAYGLQHAAVFYQSIQALQQWFQQQTAAQ